MRKLWERLPRFSELSTFRVLSVVGISTLFAAFIAYNLGIGDVQGWQLLGLAVPAVAWTGVAIWLQDRECLLEEARLRATESGGGESISVGGDDHNAPSATR